jgi:hypothetical protein
MLIITLSAFMLGAYHLNRHLAAFLSSFASPAVLIILCFPFLAFERLPFSYFHDILSVLEEAIHYQLGIASLQIERCLL